MKNQKVIYRPPESDSSDSDYEGFSFGDSVSKPKTNKCWNEIRESDINYKLFTLVENGNLEEITNVIELAGYFDINSRISGGLSLLHYACKYGHLHIVKYLIDQGANCNRQIDSITPLMEACSCKTNTQFVMEIVSLLLKHEAVINISDKYGTTPLMNACMNGLVDVARLLITSASLEALDNQGYSAIFHAVENRHVEVVKVLVQAGVSTNLSNCRGYTPLQMAQFHGFYDVVEVLPREEFQTLVPTTYMTYNTIEDYIPRIFDTDVPEYFQEINLILREVFMERFLIHFSEHKIGLREFLTISDERLEEIGIKFPFHRKQIRFGILAFHLNHWTKSSISRVKRRDSDSFFDLLMLTANHIKNLLAVSSAIKYVCNNLQNNDFGEVDEKHITLMKRGLMRYHINLTEFQNTIEYLGEFCVKRPPLFIDYNEFKTREERLKKGSWLKYSIVIGISTVFCFKLMKVL